MPFLRISAYRRLTGIEVGLARQRSCTTRCRTILFTTKTSSRLCIRMSCLMFPCCKRWVFKRCCKPKLSERVIRGFASWWTAGSSKTTLMTINEWWRNMTYIYLVLEIFDDALQRTACTGLTVVDICCYDWLQGFRFCNGVDSDVSIDKSVGDGRYGLVEILISGLLWCWGRRLFNDCDCWEEQWGNDYPVVTKGGHWWLLQMKRVIHWYRIWYISIDYDHLTLWDVFFR